MRSIHLFAFLASAFISVLPPSLLAETPPKRSNQTSETLPRFQTIIFPTGHPIKAEIADTPEDRQKGLMFRDRLPDNAGMLFIFEQAMPYRFWMKNCRFPIDIIWMNEQKAIIYIVENVPPCKDDPCPTYGPEEVTSRFVLEVMAGEAKRKRLALGQILKF